MNRENVFGAFSAQRDTKCGCDSVNQTAKFARRSRKRVCIMPRYPSAARAGAALLTKAGVEVFVHQPQPARRTIGRDAHTAYVCIIQSNTRARARPYINTARLPACTADNGIAGECATR